MAKMTPAELAAAPFNTQYEEWSRAQYQMAHHDIWWVKAQQMKAANWTLALLGALVGLAGLLHYSRTPADADLGAVLSWLSAAVVFLGGLYTWALFDTVVDARERARTIVKLVADKYDIFVPAKQPPARHWTFPVVITFVYAVALGLVLDYFGTLSPRVETGLIWAWSLFTIWGLLKTLPANGES
jgi:hypothetical protein